MAKNPIFLHIGNNVSLKKSNIVAILNPDSSTISRVTRDYVKKKQEDGAGKVISSALPAAFIVESTVRSAKTIKPGSKLYISHISAQTLADRCK